jgi:hypothetical protein
MFLVHSAPYHVDFVPEFTDIFSALIGHQDESVRRSCFSLLVALSASDLFAPCLKSVTAATESWSAAACATVLSFAGGFRLPTVLEFSGLVPLAVGWTSSGDRALSAGSRDFVEFMNFVEGAARTESKPRARSPRIARRSVDGMRKSRDKAPKMSPPRVSEPLPSRRSTSRSSAKPVAPEPAEAPEIFAGIDVEEYLTRLADSVASDGDLGATEPFVLADDSDIDQRVTTDPFVATDEEEVDSFLQVERLVSQRASASLRRSAVETLAARQAKTRMAATSSARRCRPARPVEEEDESENFFGAPPVAAEPDGLAMLNDGATQLDAINHFLRQVDKTPISLAPHCQELWSKLGDLILSSQPAVVEAALKLAGKLFAVFSQQLSGNAACMIVTVLSLLANGSCAVSQLADQLLAVIAQKAPRAKVLQVFVTATKHKSAVVRGKAAACIQTLIHQSRLDDRELASVIQALSSLLRDARSETKADARAALGLVSADARFQTVAIAVVKNSQDFRELMALVD